MGAYKYDVFLSYNSADRTIVEKIANRLIDDANITPFYDQFNLIPGDVIQETLESALFESASYAIFIGALGIGPWQNEEVRVAIQKRIKEQSVRIIPVLLTGARDINEQHLPSFLERFSVVDFRSADGSDNAFQRLVAGITGIPGGRSRGHELPSDSLFIKKSTMDMFKKEIDIDLSQIRLDTTFPLEVNARLAHVHHPRLDLQYLIRMFDLARSRVYDDKYAERATDEDERYLDFHAWEREILSVIERTGLNKFGKLDVINVGIGNGNECPFIYRSFRSMLAVDISQKAINKAKQALPFVKVMQLSAENLEGIENSTYDLYLSLRTFQSSFFDIEKSALEADRVIRRGGGAVISVPYVYMQKGSIGKGLQHAGSKMLDPHLAWEIADQIRRALYKAEFDAIIHTGVYEIYVIATK